MSDYDRSIHNTPDAQAIEQAEKQEPVAWMGLAQSNQDESLAFDKKDLEEYAFITPLYTAPPNREWVGLTDEEIAKLGDKHLVSVQEYIGSGDYVSHFEGETDFARAIEAKLKEKNT